MTILAMVMVLAGVLIAGCTQDNGSSSASGSQQASPAGTGNSQSSGNSGSPSGTYNGNGTYGNHQYSMMQNLLSNTTLLNAAAGQLGVSEQDLQNALTPVNGTRMNFTAAAQQLNVTPQQLRTALGFPAGGYRGNRTMPMMTLASGQ